MEEIKKLIDLKKSADFGKCVEVARLHFERLFNHEIQNLITIFPHDAKDKDGQPFWSGPKRAPTPIAYDPNDPLHAHFILSCANLVAFTLGITQDRDVHKVAGQAVNVVVPPFKSRAIKIELPGQQNQEENK